MSTPELSFVIPTYRLRDVSETITQYDQHFWRNGHAVRMIVFDDSTPATQEKYYSLLEQTCTHNERGVVEVQRASGDEDGRRGNGLSRGPMEYEQDAHIVLGPDGTILAVTGQVPPGLVDVRLDDCHDLSREVRDAGNALLDELRHSGKRVAVRSLAVAPGSRLQLLAIEAVPIRRAVTDVRALLASKLDVISSQAADVDVILNVETAGDMPLALRVDPEKVAWAVTTLVGNALRYMRSGTRRTSGGTITVRASFDPAPSRLLIEVQDNGPGVQAETVARLFRRDGLNVRGAGLALLMISDVCTAHGGTVDVRSSTGASDHGTTIRMTFTAR